LKKKNFYFEKFGVITRQKKLVQRGVRSDARDVSRASDDAGRRRERAARVEEVQRVESAIKGIADDVAEYIVRRVRHGTARESTHAGVELIDYAGVPGALLERSGLAAVDRLIESCVDGQDTSKAGARDSTGTGAGIEDGKKGHYFFFVWFFYFKEYIIFWIYTNLVQGCV